MRKFILGSVAFSEITKQEADNEKFPSPLGVYNPTWN